MSNKNLNKQEIENRIFTIRGIQVILDKDLAEIYEVETKVLNQAVKRNSERFPKNFRFQIKNEELPVLQNTIRSTLRSQVVTSRLTGKQLIKKNHGGNRYARFVFIEQGVSML